MRFRLQWAIQFTMACVVVGYLLHDSTTSSAFTPPYNSLSFIVVCTGGTFGQGVANLINGVRICIISYCLVTVLVAINVGQHWLAWGFVYSVGIFLISFLTDFIVTMNTLWLFVIGMVLNYQQSYGGRSSEMYSSFQIRDVVVGVGFGVLSSCFPFRLYDYQFADGAMKQCCNQCAEIITSVAACFVEQSHVRRLEHLLKLRSCRATIETQMQLLDRHCVTAWYEPVWGVRIVQNLDRLHLIEKLLLTVDVVMGVLTSASAEPVPTTPVDEVKNAICDTAAGIRNLLLKLASRRLVPADLEPLTTLREALMAKMSCCLESSETVAVVTLCMSNLVDVLVSYRECEVWTTRQRLHNALLQPLIELKQTWSMCVDATHWRGDVAPRKIIFAAKLSGAMTSFTAIALTNPGVIDPIFGPGEMAFVSGIDSTQSIQKTITQCVGAVIGTVTGFILSSFCTTTTDFVVCIGVVAFVTGFFRSSAIFGLGALYTQFAVLGSLRSWPSGGAAFAAITTNTAAILYVGIVNIAILPSRPHAILLRTICDGLELLTATIGSVQQSLQRRPSQTHLPHLHDMASTAPTAGDEYMSSCLHSLKQQWAALPSAVGEIRLSPIEYPFQVLRTVLTSERRLLCVVHLMAVAWGRLKAEDGDEEASSPSRSPRNMSLEVSLGRVTAQTKEILYDVQQILLAVDDMEHLAGIRRRFAERYAALTSATADLVRQHVPGEDGAATHALLWCWQVFPQYVLELFDALMETAETSRVL